MIDSHIVSVIVVVIVFMVSVPLESLEGVEEVWEGELGSWEDKGRGKRRRRGRRWICVGSERHLHQGHLVIDSHIVTVIVAVIVVVIRVSLESLEGVEEVWEGELRCWEDERGGEEGDDGGGVGSVLDQSATSIRDTW